MFHCSFFYYLCFTLAPRLKTFCHAQLSMKFHLVIKIKIPTVKTFFMLNSAEHAQLSWAWKKFQNFISILRFISKTNFMLSWVEHEKSFITSGPDVSLMRYPRQIKHIHVLIILSCIRIKLLIGILLMKPFQYVTTVYIFMEYIHVLITLYLEFCEN